MTHFAALVIGDNLKEQMAPYDQEVSKENAICPLVFEDEETEMRREYEEGTVNRMILPDGTLLDPNGDDFEETLEAASKKFGQAPDNFEKREVPFSLACPVFEEFVLDYFGHEERDEIQGRYGHWKNPIEKWDNFSVGGRYSGRFKLKSGKTENNPFQKSIWSVFMGGALEGYADTAALEDIDIAGMRDEAEAKAAQDYDDFHAIIDGRPLPDDKAILEQCNGDELKARKAFWAVPVMQDLWNSKRFSPYDYKLFLVPREQYLKRARDEALVTHAIVKDGYWEENDGRNGYSAEWTQKFNAIIDSLPPSTRITIVDCHI